jgi:hypothetical protein
MDIEQRTFCLIILASGKGKHTTKPLKPYETHFIV